MTSSRVFIYQKLCCDDSPDGTAPRFKHTLLLAEVQENFIQSSNMCQHLRELTNWKEILLHKHSSLYQW